MASDSLDVRLVNVVVSGNRDRSPNPAVETASCPIFCIALPFSRSGADDSCSRPGWPRRLRPSPSPSCPAGRRTPTSPLPPPTTFTIPGTEAQHASDVLSGKLPAFSGGQTTIVFATTNGSGKVTDPDKKAAIETATAKLKTVPQVSTVVDPYQGRLVSQSGKVAL